MARGPDPDSAGSQFFICLAPVHRLDHQYTTFGKLIKGDDVLEKIGDTPVDEKQHGRNEQADETRRDRKYQNRAGGFGEVSNEVRPSACRSSTFWQHVAETARLRCHQSLHLSMPLNRQRQQRLRSSRCAAARSRRRISRARLNSFATQRKKVRRSSVCRSFFGRNIFARQKTTRISIWPRKFRENRQRRWEKLARETGTVIIASLFEKRSAGRLSQHRGHHRRGRKIARQIPQDAHSGRSAVSREVLFHAGRSWVSGVANTRTAKSASAFAGTNGIRKRRA